MNPTPGRVAIALLGTFSLLFACSNPEEPLDSTENPVTTIGSQLSLFTWPRSLMTGDRIAIQPLYGRHCVDNDRAPRGGALTFSPDLCTESSNVLFTGYSESTPSPAEAMVLTLRQGSAYGAHGPREVGWIDYIPNPAVGTAYRCSFLSLTAEAYNMKPEFVCGNDWVGQRLSDLMRVFIAPAAPLINLALGRPSSQSSTYSPGAASHKAVDGNSDGSYGHGSVTHTAQPLDRDAGPVSRRQDIEKINRTIDRYQSEE